MWPTSLYALCSIIYIHVCANMHTCREGWNRWVTVSEWMDGSQPLPSRLNPPPKIHAATPTPVPLRTSWPLKSQLQTAGWQNCPIRQKKCGKDLEVGSIRQLQTSIILDWIVQRIHFNIKECSAYHLCGTVTRKRQHQNSTWAGWGLGLGFRVWGVLGGVEGSIPGTMSGMQA